MKTQEKAVRGASERIKPRLEVVLRKCTFWFIQRIICRLFSHSSFLINIVMLQFLFLDRKLLMFFS